MEILATIALVLLLLVVAVVLVLLVPVGVTAKGSSGERYRIDLVWLFGAVRVPLRGERHSSKSKEKRAPKKRKPRWWRQMPANPGEAIASILRLGGRSLKTLRFTGCGELAFGLDDPAETGIVWGYLSPLTQFGKLGDMDLRVTPAFLGSHLSFSGIASVEAVPLRIVIPVGGFILSSEGRTLIRSVRSRG